MRAGSPAADRAAHATVSRARPRRRCGRVHRSAPPRGRRAASSGSPLSTSPSSSRGAARKPPRLRERGWRPALRPSVDALLGGTRFPEDHVVARRRKTLALVERDGRLRGDGRAEVHRTLPEGREERPKLARGDVRTPRPPIGGSDASGAGGRRSLTQLHPAGDSCGGCGGSTFSVTPHFTPLSGAPPLPALFLSRNWSGVMSENVRYCPNSLVTPCTTLEMR